MRYHVDLQLDSPEPFGIQAEHTIRVNFFGVLNTCRTLFPLLRSHSRVVNMSSSYGHLSQMNGQEPAASQLKAQFASHSLTEQELCQTMNQFVQAAQAGTHFEQGWCNSTYMASKVGISALTFIQQRAFDADVSRPDIVVNSVHPGYVDTDMTRHTGPLTIYEGAKAPLYLALLPPDAKEPRGQFVWRDCSIVDWVNGPMPGPV
ncbi:hypothetical protein B566_EDAN019396 [Ephemera danica]|nr:hypothetical protein B566_EDAN019396 [Ephemera danica]